MCEMWRFYASLQANLWVKRHLVSGLWRFLRFCRKVRFLGQNPKIEYREFNDLQTAKLSKKQLCDRTLGGPSRAVALNSVRLNFCMVAELSDATVRDGRSTPSHWPNRSGRNRASHRCVWSARARPTG